jgi:hypothetical protein
MMPDDTFEWDPHSDQPHVIRDRGVRRRLYLLGAMGSLKTLLVGLLALPVAGLYRRLRPVSALPAAAASIGLGVNLESELADKTTVSLDALVEEVVDLGVDHLLLRVVLGEQSSLAPYLELADRFAGRQLLVDVLQDRKHIEDHALLEAHLRQVFSGFATYTNAFKIGNAVNRRKWAFHSLDEYFAFFGVAQRLRDREFPQIELHGGSIIDFELPNFARSLLHGYPISYDVVAALLYVDRRGAPENAQLGVNLLGKISWFRALMQMSRKCGDRLVITETNWPLEGTEPFAPAVGECMVDEGRQAAYLARYYLLSFASGQVEAVYWHQLVAPGYGLIDNRGASVRRRRAFYAFKTLVGFFSHATIESFETRGDLFMLTARRGRQTITALWTNDIDTTLTLSQLLAPVTAAGPADTLSIFSLTGERLEASESLLITGDAIYLLQEQAR